MGLWGSQASKPNLWEEVWLRKDSLKNKMDRAIEVTRKVKALTAILDDLSSVSKIPHS